MKARTEKKNEEGRKPGKEFELVFSWFPGFLIDYSLPLSVFNPWLKENEVIMAQAVVDPAELRRFAQNLKRFNAELQNGMAVLHGQLVGLGDTWRDQEHIKFTQEFEQTMQALERYMEVGNEHIAYLLRKAERIDEYLQQK